MTLSEGSIKTESGFGGAIGFAVFSLVCVFIVGELESYKVLDVKSIIVETAMFVFVMFVTDVSNNTKKNYIPNFASLAKVALIIILTVLPAFANHLNDGRDGYRIFSCLLQDYQYHSSRDIGLGVVSVFLVVGALFAFYTALMIRKSKASGDNGYSGLSAFMTALVAVVMLSIHLFLNHLNDEIVSCSDVNTLRRILVSAFGFLFVGLLLFLVGIRHVSVCYIIPVIRKNEAPASSVMTLYKSFLLIVFFVLAICLAFYYRGDLLANPFLLLLFVLIAFCLVALIGRAFIQIKAFWFPVLLVLTVTLSAVGVGYLFGVYLMSRDGEDLIEIQLDEDTIEYLNKQ